MVPLTTAWLSAAFSPSLALLLPLSAAAFVSSPSALRAMTKSLSEGTASRLGVWGGALYRDDTAGNRQTLSDREWDIGKSWHSRNGEWKAIKQTSHYQGRSPSCNGPCMQLQSRVGLITASCRAYKTVFQAEHQSLQIVVGRAMGFSLTRCPEQLAVYAAI